MGAVKAEKYLIVTRLKCHLKTVTILNDDDDDDDVRPPSSEMTMTSLVLGVGAEMTDEANPRTKQAVALGTREAVSWVGLWGWILAFFPFLSFLLFLLDPSLFKVIDS